MVKINLNTQPTDQWEPKKWWYWHFLTIKRLQSTKASVQFSRSVMSDSLWPHDLQHARPPCPSPTPGVHPYSCPSSRWCHPAISSSVVPFSSCPQSLPASESFPMSQLFTWDGQSIRVSASASVLPKNTQGWSPLEWTDWISLKVYSTHIFHQILDNINIINIHTKAVILFFK